MKFVIHEVKAIGCIGHWCVKITRYWRDRRDQWQIGRHKGKNYGAALAATVAEKCTVRPIGSGARRSNVARSKAIGYSSKGMCKLDDVVVSKFADRLPLYRQSQILARLGVRIERSTLAGWVGTAAAELQPLHDHLVGQLRMSPKLFCDETRCPVLDPGRGETKTGYMWALARDDRPWGGELPPSVAYTYAPGRGGVHAVKLLEGFSGVLQVDGYAAYDQLARLTRAGGPITLAFCWSHLRRRFYELYIGGNQPIATEALARIKQLYDIEAEIRGLPLEVRRAMRQEKAKPLVEALRPWLE